MRGRISEEYKKKLLALEDGAKLIQSGDTIIGGMVNGEPLGMLKAIGKRAMAGEFDGVEYICMGPRMFDEWVAPGHSRHMRLNTAFIDSSNHNIRNSVNKGFADFTPCHGGILPAIITDRIKDIPYGKVKVINSVAPMDEHGFFCLATSPSYVLEPARRENTIVILEVNRNQPRVYGGDNFLHISQIDYIVEYDFPLTTVPFITATSEDLSIAKFIVDMIEDGSTIQLGIGGIPNTVAKLLVSKNDLGAYTEMLGDAYKYLWDKGVLTGKKKTVSPSKINSCFAMGSMELYEWMNENPLMEFYSQGWTNDVLRIAQNNKMVAINQALEIDLTGQVASESLGPFQYTATGGQLQFTQGAQLSPGGKSFTCMNAVAETRNGRVSKIVPLLTHGAAVTVPRTEVQYVVTEFGAALLKGKTFRERAEALIQIAHPDFRADLRHEAKKLGYL